MDQREKKGFPAWYTISFLGFLGILNTFAMCFNFNIMFYSIVKEPINTYNNDTDENYSGCPEVMYSNLTDKNHSEFSWDFKTQRIVLESFFYGFCLSQIPAGFSSDVYGGKWPFGISVLVTAFACLLIPLAARTSVEALISVRIVQGMAAGISFPSINTLLSKWVPKLERSSHSAFILNGIPLSNVYTYIIIAYLLQDKLFFGWPSVFYLQGTLSVVWFLFWSILIFESPEDHKFLSESEVRQLRKSQDREVKFRLNIYEVPWKTIMTSTKVWALIVAHSGYCWNYATFIINFPIYFSKALKDDEIKSSLKSSLLFVSSAIFSFSSGIIADGLRMKKYRINTIRKVMNSFAFFVPALCLIPIPYVGCKGKFVFALQLFANAFIGVANSGFRVTHVDMCPELAGILVAITGTFGSIFGCFAIAYNEWVLQTGHSSKNWKIVFFTSAAVIYVTGMIYNFFADSEEQEWVSDLKAVNENTETPEEEKNSEEECKNAKSNQ